MSRNYNQDHLDTTLDAVSRAIREDGVEVRIEIDNFDEFRSFFSSIIRALQDEGVLDEKKPSKPTRTEELSSRTRP